MSNVSNVTDTKGGMFRIGDVLSVTTGRMVSDGGIAGLYDLLNFMTGDQLHSHQLSRAIKICGPRLRSQDRKIESATSEVLAALADGVRREAISAFMVAKFGAEVEVSRLPDGAWQHVDPVDELEGMRRGGGARDADFVRTLDYEAARRAAERIAEICRDADFTAPDAVELHHEKIRHVTGCIDVIVDSLRMPKTPK